MPRVRLIDPASWPRRRRQRKAARQVSLYLRRLEASLAARIAQRREADVLDAAYVDIQADIRRGIRGVERLFGIEGESGG